MEIDALASNVESVSKSKVLWQDGAQCFCGQPPLGLCGLNTDLVLSPFSIL